MKRDIRLFLEDMIEQIKLIENSIKKKDKNRLLTNRILRDATVRRLEIIGEAAKNIPGSIGKKYPEVDGIKNLPKIQEFYKNTDA